LAVAKDGDTGRIVRIAGRCEVRRFLSDLGFVIGADVSVVNTISGNLLLDVRGTRIAMDRTMASKVFIMPEGS
jgi:ferrous iron transport protein A